MKELSLNKLENLVGGKFWGETCTTGSIGGGDCITTCKYQAFWLTVGTSSSISPC
jgi:hypothetical protein